MTSSSLYISPSLVEPVRTNVDTESPITAADGLADPSREKWNSLIDYRLIEWARNPRQLDDEDVEPATRETIRLAIELAQGLRDAGLTPPDSIVPDPNGGIVFERRERDISEVFHVWDDGIVEYCIFQGTRLVGRRTL